MSWSSTTAPCNGPPWEAVESLIRRIRYEDKTSRERRTEDDVWRHFKRDLEARQLLRYLTPKKIAVRDDEIEFQHTWKNGVLHCLEPISFDLASPDTIREKAHRWLGRVSSVASESKDFRLYFLVGQPQDDQLESAFDSALSILRKMPVPTEIFREQEVGKLADMLAGQVAKHESKAVR